MAARRRPVRGVRRVSKISEVLRRAKKNWRALTREEGKTIDDARGKFRARSSIFFVLRRAAEYTNWGTNTITNDIPGNLY